MQRITLDDYITHQTSGNSTVDLYWNLVQYKYLNAHNDFDAKWNAKQAIKDARAGINIIDIIIDSSNADILTRYKQQFIRIIKELENL